MCYQSSLLLFSAWWVPRAVSLNEKCVYLGGPRDYTILPENSIKKLKRYDKTENSEADLVNCPMLRVSVAIL